MKVAVLSFAHERAETYARLLRDMPGVALVTADPGAAPGDPARGPAVAARLGVPYADSWDEVFAARPDAVVVTSEVAARRDLVERAARAGAQVLCEHPPAGDEADAQAVVDVCKQAGVRLTLASPACCGDAFAAVRRGIAEQAVGRLVAVHGAYHSRPPLRAGADGGALSANAPFLLDLVDAVLDGEPAVQVYAQANGVLGGQPGAESAVLVSVRYAGGRVAGIDCGWSPAGVRPESGPTLSLVGDRASLEFDARPKLLGGFDAAAAGERREPAGPDPYAAVLDDFLSTAAGRGPGRGPDGAAGVRTMRVIQAARTSLRTGQPVDIG